MIKLINISDIVCENGKTTKENNLEIQHKIPIGTLVEVKFDGWFGDGACWKVHARLYVVSHDRDCDGTPLYRLSRWTSPQIHELPGQSFGGLNEESLHPVEVTQKLKDGIGVLEWED